MSFINLDTLIIGGGIAGLWLLDELRRANYDALLVEQNALGAGQTIASQGIIHGGLKYTLGGLLTPSADAIKEMPLIWRECLVGEREPNLIEVRLRDPECTLWRTDSLTSQLGMVGAKIGLRVALRKITDAERPLPLKNCPGNVFRLDEKVIDPASLLDAFARRNYYRIVKGSISFRTTRNGEVNEACLMNPATQKAVRLRPRNVVLAAGEGNAQLRELCGLSTTAMQRRPLHFVIAKGQLPVLNGHCVDGAKTRVTITTQKGREGVNIWQIGGQITEDGVKMKPAELAAHARRELHAVLPGFDLPEISIATFRIDRAEAATPDGSRPSDAQAIRDGNVITCWPTKLALAPRLAELVREMLPAPGGESSVLQIFKDWPRPRVSPFPWETSQCVFDR